MGYWFANHSLAEPFPLGTNVVLIPCNPICNWKTLAYQTSALVDPLTSFSWAFSSCYFQNLKSFWNGLGMDRFFKSAINPKLKMSRPITVWIAQECKREGACAFLSLRRKRALWVQLSLRRNFPLWGALKLWGALFYSRFALFAPSADLKMAKIHFQKPNVVNFNFWIRRILRLHSKPVVLFQVRSFCSLGRPKNGQNPFSKTQRCKF